MWDDLSVGAIGAVIMADTRRIADCFASIDYFERSGHAVHHRGQLLRRRPPVRARGHQDRSDAQSRCADRACDARDRDSVKKVLVVLVRYVMSWSNQVGKVALS